MFSGIVETQTKAREVRLESGLVRLTLLRPATFTDLNCGDSVCVNGVCLTIETFDGEVMTFALGAETLAVTGWNEIGLRQDSFNVERSLRFGDRIHGHVVSGHVDATGSVARREDLGGSLALDIDVPIKLLPYVWPKGSWTVNGVSLTINSVHDSRISVCLIPETLARTNLGSLKEGSRVNLEVDMMARGLVHYFNSVPLSTLASSTRSL